MVGGMSVGVAFTGGGDAGVSADEDADKVWFKDIDEGGEV